MSLRRPSRGVLLRWLLLVAVVVVATVYLAPKFGNAVGQLHRLHDVHAAWLTVTVAAEFASLLAFSAVTYILLQPGSRPRFRKVFQLDLVTVALSHAVPAGSAAGTALGYELLEEQGVEPVESGFVKVTQAVLSTMLLQVLLAVSLLLKIAVYGPSAANAGLAAAGGVLLALIGVFVWLLACRPATIRRIAVRSLRRVPRVPQQRVGDVLVDVSGHVRALLGTPRQLVWACVWSMGNWVFDLVSLWAALRALGPAPDPVVVAVGFSVAQVAALLPVSPAGLGVVEGTLIPLLTGLGTPAAVALLGVFAWRLANFWLPLPMGGAAYLMVLVQRRRSQRRSGAPAQPELILNVSPDAGPDRVCSG